MTPWKLALTGLIALSILSPVAYANSTRKETLGTMIGPYLGTRFDGVMGKLVMSALGIVAGGLIGDQIGRSLVRARRRRERTERQSDRPAA